MVQFSEIPVPLFVAFGVLSGILSTFAYIPYIRDTLAGQTRPQRASWLIWSVLGSIALFSQVHEGAGASLWFAGVQVGGTVAVFLLSIRRGVGGFLKRGDCGVLAVAMAGLVLWSLTDSAAYALVISVSISLLGGSVTVVKAFRDPRSETLSMWSLSLVASCCAMVSVGAIDWVLLAYPMYLLVLNGAIVLAILLGSMRLSLGEARACGPPAPFCDHFPVPRRRPFPATGRWLPPGSRMMPGEGSRFS